jgi:K+-sensing histidine kinase KdpD
MEIGANDYLIKPFLAQELLTAINTQLKKQAIFKQESQKKLDTLRSNISSSVPHELLTPLNGIMGLSSLLIEDYKNMPESEVIECLQDIYNSGTRLLKSIEKFLLFSDLKITLANSARIQVYRQTKYQTPTKDLIAYVANEIAQRSQRQNDLHLQLEDILVDISAIHLHKIVEEIIDNAFKFSDIGTPVLLTAKAEGSIFVLDVSDQGRGLSETGINEIGAYMQFDRKYHEQQGLGLGLAIVQLIIELNSGSFGIESKVKDQTILHITLPI